jgi:protein-L-isoaspartate(D-aspartate) O-methyltransferase
VSDVSAAQRRFFAEEIQAVCNLRTPALVEALATVPREAFLPPGPWTIRAEGDYGEPPRQTPDADPRHVSHNISVAIDPARTLFNGAPSVVAMCIDRLAIAPGHSVLHVGTGHGYYTALMAQMVGPLGRVDGVEVDPVFAEASRANLASWSHADARHGNGVDGIGESSCDAILVSAGMTHPHEAWLAALKPGGRLVVPLTFTLPQMGPIGKGAVALLTRDATGDEFSARVFGMVAIYSAVGIRDESLNAKLRDAYMRGAWPGFTRLRRDAHDESPPCWLHGSTLCLSA